MCSVSNLESRIALITGSTQETFIQGKTKLTITKKEKAPLEESNLRVFLELTDTGFDCERHGVDMVAVLDVGESMASENLNKLKSTVNFIIQKLSSADRLSIITFSKESMRLCPLTQITKLSQAEITKLVNNLTTHPGSNISAGLELASQVLQGRRHVSGRVAAIMLMSNGHQSKGSRDASHFALDHIPIYTFGFGDNCDQKVLKAIAETNGGLFTSANVENTPSNNLSTMFSESLGKLLNEDVQNLELTIKQLDSKIEKVNVGSYPVSRNNDDDSTTIFVGNLYKHEILNLSVDLLLPAVNINNKGKDVLEITLSYSNGENRFDTCRIIVCVTRTSQVVLQEKEDEPTKEQIVTEESKSINNVEYEQKTVTSKIMDDKAVVEAKKPIFISNVSATAKDFINPVTSFWGITKQVQDSYHVASEYYKNVKKGENSNENAATDKGSADTGKVKDDALEHTTITGFREPEIQQQTNKQVNLKEEFHEATITMDSSEMPANMDLLMQHVKEAIESVQAMQDALEGLH